MCLHLTGVSSEASLSLSQWDGPWVSWIYPLQSLFHSRPGLALRLGSCLPSSFHSF